MFSPQPVNARYRLIDAAISRLEHRSAAEVVVVVRQQSGLYRDADLIGGVLLGLLALCYAIFNPWTIHAPSQLPLDFIVFAVVGAVAVRLCWPLRRVLSGVERRRAQVELCARALYADEGIYETRARTGLLVYLSRFERRASLQVDTGVLAAVGPERVSSWRRDLGLLAQRRAPLEALCDWLGELERSLAEALPSTDDNPDELPNLPERCEVEL